MNPNHDLEALRRTYAAIVDEARGAVATGRAPDARALEARVRAARGSVGDGTSAALVSRAERTALEQLERVFAVHRARALVAREPIPPPATGAPRRPRALLRSRPTMSGNMEVRREESRDEHALAWDAVPAVAAWEVRISERPDPRADYVVLETLTLPAATTRVELPLGDVPLRVHVLGRSRDGRLVRRALISAVTRDTWSDRWQRRASAS